MWIEPTLIHGTGLAGRRHQENEHVLLCPHTAHCFVSQSGLWLMRSQTSALPLYHLNGRMGQALSTELELP